LALGGREWQKAEERLYKEELHATQIITRIIKSRKIRWVRHVACKGEMRNVDKILVRNPEGKKPFGRPRHGWDDIRPNLSVTGWINLAQDKDQQLALLNKVMDFWVP
jgi:hypothetical protein